MSSIFKVAVLLLVLRDIEAASQGEEVDFTYNGFIGANVSLDGLARINNGLLQLTNHTLQEKSHVFYNDPIHFLNQSSSDGSAAVVSFSTTFVFAILTHYPDFGGHGLAFVISPTKGLPDALPSQWLGLFNDANIGNLTNHVFAVELDTIKNKEFKDTNNNHVGVDINGLASVAYAPASYLHENGKLENLTLISGNSIQVWVDYDGPNKQLNVTLAPTHVSKPGIPLLSLSQDLSSLMKETMFVGFSSSTGSIPTSHYVLGWSFKLNGQAKELNLSQLPKIPKSSKKSSTLLTVGLPIIAASLVLGVILGIFIRWKIKFAEVLEEWELDYGPHRFKYKDLYVATNGFKHSQLLGVGGFGRVYRGVLPISKTEVAVKKVSHDSKQGMKEFVAEIVSVGQLRHRNLVKLLGYSRRKSELLLVYEFMPNASLDKFLFNQSVLVLSWSHRLRIIQDVASALVYLHEEWEKVVLHRDVKSSNVLLDRELNGRLGDFGLAKLYDHGSDPQTTQLVGTLGYLAPELPRTGLANPSTDVFAFGAFVLEVACGRRPIEPRASPEEVMLVDWVFSCKRRGRILATVDPNLGINYVQEEMELVLNLGLVCSHSVQTARPTMRQALQYLEGKLLLPDLSSLCLSTGGIISMNGEAFTQSLSTSSQVQNAPPSSVELSELLLFSGGR